MKSVWYQYTSRCAQARIIQQPEQPFTKQSQTAGRNNEDTHSFARWKWRLHWLQCRVWDMTAKWNGMSNLQMDAVIVNDECDAFRMLRRAAHGPARFYSELFSIWMSEATYYTGWLCFGIDGIWSYQDPGEKYYLASTDWWQLVRLKCGPATCKVYEFWKWICKMFRNENRARMKLIARAATTCATASLMWWREFCLEYNLKTGNELSSTQMVVPVTTYWSRWGIYMRSHLQGSSTLSRDVRISSNVIDRPCHSWMRERTGWTTCQIEKWRGLWPIQTDESKVRRCWVFWDD